MKFHRICPLWKNLFGYLEKSTFGPPLEKILTTPMYVFCVFMLVAVCFSKKYLTLFLIDPVARGCFV